MKYVVIVCKDNGRLNKMKINTKITGFEPRETKDARKAKYFRWMTADGTNYNIFNDKLNEALKGLLDKNVALTVVKKGEFTNIVGVEELEDSFEAESVSKGKFLMAEQKAEEDKARGVVPNSQGAQRGYNISYAKDVVVALIENTQTDVSQLKNLTDIAIATVKQIYEGFLPFFVPF